MHIASEFGRRFHGKSTTPIRGWLAAEDLQDNRVPCVPLSGGRGAQREVVEATNQESTAITAARSSRASSTLWHRYRSCGWRFRVRVNRRTMPTWSLSMISCGISECLKVRSFRSLADKKMKLDTLRFGDNENRPHKARNHPTLRKYAAETADASRKFSG